MPPFHALSALLPRDDLDFPLPDTDETLVRVGRRSRFPASDARNDGA